MNITINDKSYDLKSPALLYAVTICMGEELNEENIKKCIKNIDTFYNEAIIQNGKYKYILTKNEVLLSLNIALEIIANIKELKIKIKELNNID